MMSVLFVSIHPLNRAENIKAVYDAYDGAKEFVQRSPGKYDGRLLSPEFSVCVTDEFIGFSPGKLIMIGHGIAGGKTYGLDQPGAYHNRKQAKLIDYVVTSSRAIVSLVAKQSGVPESKVLPLGMPRTDAYFGSHKGDGHTIMSGKRAYFYAPTFRSRRDPSFPNISWQTIDEGLSDDEIFVVKPHMVMRHGILKGEYKHIIEVSPDEPSTPYLIDCDVLITDYSSIMLDAHVLEKPVVLFEKNQGYTKSRGMYLPYPDGYASRYAQNETLLLHYLRTADAPRALDTRCRKITASACDGHSTERVVDLLKKVIADPEEN